jgi:hypothetical protein
MVTPTKLVVIARTNAVIKRIRRSCIQLLFLSQGKEKDRTMTQHRAKPLPASLIMGDLVLFEDEVNPVMSVLLEP